MDVAEELLLLRSRIDAIEEKAERAERPSDPDVALVVIRNAGPAAGEVATCAVRRVDFETVEGAAPTFTATDAVVEALLLAASLQAATHSLCVPIRGSRYVVLA